MRPKTHSSLLIVDFFVDFCVHFLPKKIDADDSFYAFLVFDGLSAECEQLLTFKIEICFSDKHIFGFAESWNTPIHFVHRRVIYLEPFGVFFQQFVWFVKWTWHLSFVLRADSMLKYLTINL